LPLISVAVPIPYLDPLTYNVPGDGPIPAVGTRVRVPVGSRIVVGCVVGHDAVLDEAAKVRDVDEVLDAEPLLTPAVLDLCRWVADYYMCGLGDAIGAAMPPGSRRPSSFKSRKVVAATPHGLGVVAARSVAGGAPDDRLTAKQRTALDALAATASGLPLSILRDRGIGADTVRRLAMRGLVSIRDERLERDPFEGATLPVSAEGRSREGGRVLTDEQQAAVETLSRVVDARRFQVALVHGVTGSGKTEVYMRLVERVVRGGRQALVMVPEISLTPSLAALVRGVYGSRVAIQHSGMSNGERHDQWHRIRRGEVDVVIGTRSAVFAPLENLGLLVIDEEHDASYKQDETPRYHGRDAGIVRGQAAGALVVLGSATPSMESHQHAVTGKYLMVRLERRVLDRPLASVQVVNMRDEYAQEGPDVVVSRPLAAGIEDRLTRGEQVLVLLNRRGYATAVFCRQCGDTFECPNCSVSLTVHGTRRGWRARCHYCNYAVDVPSACRGCAAPYLEQAGFGTERIEQAVRERFPAARVARVDRDSVSRKGALTDVLTRFSRGDVDVLVGTQMIAKGHDFPRVTLVGVVSADIGLGVADFRAAERTFQLLTQVAGRAGRGERPGEAIVQTLFPEHYTIKVACRQDYGAFFERESVYRRTMRYPPSVALINVVVRGRTFPAAMDIAVSLVRRLEPAAARTPFALLGPAPAPLSRLRGEHRVQFFLKGHRRTAMRQALRDALTAGSDAARITVDVDPVNLS
jgi:primosomal protein N' (replication factor Y)